MNFNASLGYSLNETTVPTYHTKGKDEKHDFIAGPQARVAKWLRRQPGKTKAMVLVQQAAALL